MEPFDKIVCTVCHYSLTACVALNQQGGKRFWTGASGPVCFYGGSVLAGMIVRIWKSCLGQLRT